MCIFSTHSEKFDIHHFEFIKDFSVSILEEEFIRYSNKEVFCKAFDIFFQQLREPSWAIKRATDTF